MPTYEYACTACRTHVEVVQRITDDPLTVCPSCGGALRKVFSPVGVVFKGSGFYRTDSRSTTADTKAGETGSSSDKTAAKKAPESTSTSSKSSDAGTTTGSTSTKDSGKVA